MLVGLIRVMFFMSMPM